jgi:hypothetical protein
MTVVRMFFQLPEGTVVHETEADSPNEVDGPVRLFYAPYRE